MLGFLPQYEEYKVNKKTIFWPISLSLYAISMMCFGLAPWLGKPVLAIANISLIWGAFSISILFRSWRLAIKNSTLIYASIFMLGLASAYLVLLEIASTVIQIHFMNSVLSILSIWQIYELLKQIQKKGAFQIKALLVVVFLQFFTRTARSADLLFLSNLDPITLYGEEIVGFILRVFSILLILLKCILIANYFLENI